MSARTAPSRRGGDEEGFILILSMIFLAVCGLVIAALFAFTGSSFGVATALGETRARDFDAESSLNASIASIRASSTDGYPGTCLPSGYTPTWTLNVPGRLLRVDCAVQGYAPYERHVVLSVCPSSVAAPCPETSSVLKADVTFYDALGTVAVTTWSHK
jgi:hypothetical protein